MRVILTVRVPSFGDVTETSPHLREFSDTGGRLRVSDARWLIYLILVFSFLLVLEEVRFVYLWCPGAPCRTPHLLFGRASRRSVLALDHDVAGTRVTRTVSTDSTTSNSTCPTPTVSKIIISYPAYSKISDI